MVLGVVTAVDVGLVTEVDTSECVWIGGVIVFGFEGVSRHGVATEVMAVTGLRGPIGEEIGVGTLSGG